MAVRRARSRLFRPILSRDFRRRHCLKELARTNDVVRMSFLRALLKDAGIEFDVFDSNMNIAEGGNAALLAPRLMVATKDYERAKRLLREAGVDEG